MVAVRREADQAVVEVTDTGVGIAPEHLPRIFERFYRADPSRGRAAGGAGLGLPIARAIVEAHGGQLTLRSAPGAGTRAAIHLRLLAADHRLPGHWLLRRGQASR